MNHFWIHQEKASEGYGYGQFTIKHLLLVALTAIATVFVCVLYINSNQVNRILIRRTIGITLIVIDIIKMIVLSKIDIELTDYLPLEVCSFAAYFIVIDSFWLSNNIIPQMLLTLFLPAAIMAIIFPTTTKLPVFNFFTIHQFLFHGLIIMYVFMRFFALEIPLTYSGVWKSILIVSCLVATMYFVDVKFDKNYMFLRDTFANPLLEFVKDKTKNNIGYTPGLLCFSAFMIHIFYFIFKLIEILLLK